MAEPRLEPILLQEKSGAVPLEASSTEGSRVQPTHRQLHHLGRSALPEPAGGGEQNVLKLFAFTQAFAVGTGEALRRREDGQTMAEYGVILALITLTVVASMTLLSDNLRSAFESIASILPG